MSTETTADGPRGDEGVHTGTVYRFEGLRAVELRRGRPQRAQTDPAGDLTVQKQ
ncbi:hypothetical protein QQY24_07725 [Streptomyces sp. TG1A-8]|uniref:hypothetical protein n=1 Tax=Streptomyces sp. TG1A-8 TaxID=3051385 RepID=UPI00265BF541|nr:hypothetical protein [Streptomyces sp. TG1A-8]MDO0925311.1 hypothetical protein [Streptomyces sp. TG1A-8]